MFSLKKIKKCSFFHSWYWTIYAGYFGSHLALVVDGEVAVHGVRQGVDVGRVLVLRLRNI
jgi:hypothetical protein